MSKDEVVVQPGETGDISVESKGLKGGALGLVSSIVVGMASTAPAYSLAATLGLIIASGGALLSGVKAPAIVLISFIPMLFIAAAFYYLNKADPDCGTTFSWVTRALGPWAVRYSLSHLVKDESTLGEEMWARTDVIQAHGPLAAGYLTGEFSAISVSSAASTGMASSWLAPSCSRSPMTASRCSMCRRARPSSTSRCCKMA